MTIGIRSRWQSRRVKIGPVLHSSALFSVGSSDDGVEVPSLDEEEEEEGR